MTTAPVVVGVDGFAAAGRALDHAIDEAVLRRRPLRVVCADAGGPEPGTAVQEALDRVAARSPVPVTGELVAGRPARVLVEESQRAALLVLGYRGGDRRRPVALGSVARTVVAGAACPVLVIRGAGSAAGPGVVGVNGSAAGDAAVGFAFEEADLRGAPLTAVRA